MKSGDGRHSGRRGHVQGLPPSRSHDRPVGEGAPTPDARLEQGFERSLVPVALVDLDGRFLRVNAALCAFLGRDEAEVVGRSMLAFTHPDDVVVTNDATRQLSIGDRQHVQVEKRYVRPDGSVVWGLAAATLIDVDATAATATCRSRTSATARLPSSGWRRCWRSTAPSPASPARSRRAPRRTPSTRWSRARWRASCGATSARSSASRATATRARSRPTRSPATRPFPRAPATSSTAAAPRRWCRPRAVRCGSTATTPRTAASAACSPATATARASPRRSSSTDASGARSRWRRRARSGCPTTLPRA